MYRNIFDKIPIVNESDLSQHITQITQKLSNTGSVPNKSQNDNHDDNNDTDQQRN